ncbi:LytTR family DNA-binding domain-containing protein [Peptostreptococcus faecalis]|uniref:LytTR family DNA-binding domain-containing protein n=1 Tax=Peptostreptococcus faecalis TaxID=2045015 RepID=UPI000C7C38C7|nr:LytTR family DNA-binding domain-containing protein [Peptostreptococcus faecalis]
MKIKLDIDNNLKPKILILRTREETDEIKEIVSLIKNKNTILNAKKESINYKKSTEEFISFFSFQKKVYGRTKDEELLISSRLYELEEILSDEFVRISNTEIINLNYVNRFEVTKEGLITINFKDGSTTNSSRRYLKKVKEKLF